MRKTIQHNIFLSATTKTTHAKEQAVWTIHIDGASRGNPGPAGAGIYIRTPQGKLHAHGFFIGNKTNNQAEYMALILGLMLTKAMLEKNHNNRICIISDSELLVRQMRGEYRVKNAGLRAYANYVRALITDIPVVFEHVLREKNKQADALANEGLDTRKAVPKELRTTLQMQGINVST